MRIQWNMLIIVVSAIVSGCVSSGEYKARLTDIENLKSDVSKCEAVVKTKDAEIAAQKQTAVKLDAELKAKEVERTTEKAALKDEIAKRDSEIQKKDTKKKELDGRYTRLTKEYDEQLKENSSLKQTIASSHDQMAKQIVEMKSQARERDSRVKFLEDDIVNKSGNIAALKDDVSKSKERHAALEADVRARDSEKMILEKTIAERDGQIKNLQVMVQNKTVEISDLKKDIRELSTDRAKVIEEKEKVIAELRKTHDNLIFELSDEIKKGEIEVTQLRDKLSLQMVERILFDSGSADIKGTGKKILERVSGILKKVTDKQIRIEGHTDNVPIGPRIAKKFATNWELSTARATNVVRFIKEKGGMDGKYLSAAGYSEHKPIAPNDSDENKAKNRRIEIVLIPFETDRLSQNGK